LCVSGILGLLADKCLTAGGRERHKAIVEGKGDWVYLLMAVWVLLYLEADAVDPGNIQRSIYQIQTKDENEK
jgi:hypothetical protein